MANRGEWAELYVLFKLLGEGRIYAADETLNRNPDSYLDIIKIIREEVRNCLIEYNTGTIVEIKLGNETIVSIPAEEFLRNAEILLQTICTSEGRSFDVLSETNEFRERALVLKHKSPSRGYYDGFGGKNDIIMQIRERALTYIAGFSIKSKYKHASTLFNASKASSIAFELVNLTSIQMNEINSLLTNDGGKDKEARIKYIKDNNIDFTFSHFNKTLRYDYSVFEENLRLANGRELIETLPYFLKVHYFNNCNKVSDIVAWLITENPLNSRNPEALYCRLIKEFLYVSFAGMTPATPWNGTAVVNGGYIIAKDDGEVLAYHTRDIESFKSFLFNSTKIDRPAASSRRCNYAHVYQENDRYYFDLNFQIRFI
ncbi:MAG: HpaII family restriction endonuclease [Firmicutes bacterium]|nr:HpaII family restriction endonuclease [Bacillota bacterium]